MRRALVALAALLVIVACVTANRPPPAPSVQPLGDPAIELIVTPSPDGHGPFLRAIAAAKTSIAMTMFHLTDTEVVTALVAAAGRGVAVRVIVDGKSLAARANREAAEALRAGGVTVRGSSPAFAITHEKAMVVDGELALVTAINLTRDADRTRDLGIATRDRAVVAGVAALFEADWHNAEARGRATPALAAPSLIVAPTTARGRLLALIGSARHTLILTVENLGDAAIVRALADAASRGVAVRVIVPLCDKNPDPLYDLPAARRLAAAGVAARVMPPPESADTPYMHSKMIQVDDAATYIGSVNFSASSLDKSRELGIIVAEPRVAAQVEAVFEADWAHAIAPPAPAEAACHRGAE
ncbi:MAG TPA: phospholipase D-like domain-containing protein [Kofleriaceae bacterium]|nr:phospholipase D-like domain-containing protein [Kofleriaceae bacterium]